MRLAVLIAALGIGGCSLFDSPLVTACEEALADQLVAASTYRRIKVSEIKQPLSLDEYFRANKESPAVETLYRNGGNNPARFNAFIEYDVLNALGVPLRKRAICSYDTVAGDPPKSLTKLSVLVDGKTIADRILDRAKAIQTGGR